MSELRFTKLIGLAVATADNASNEKSPRENIEMNGDKDAEK